MKIHLQLKLMKTKLRKVQLSALLTRHSILISHHLFMKPTFSIFALSAFHIPVKKMHIYRLICAVTSGTAFCDSVPDLER